MVGAANRWRQPDEDMNVSSSNCYFSRKKTLSLQSPAFMLALLPTFTPRESGFEQFVMLSVFQQVILCWSAEVCFFFFLLRPLSLNLPGRLLLQLFPTFPEITSSWEGSWTGLLLWNRAWKCDHSAVSLKHLVVLLHQCVLRVCCWWRHWHLCLWLYWEYWLFDC